MDNRLQHIIQEGTKVYAKTRYSNMTLLCTVIMMDNYNIKVKLPCKIKGHETDVVNLKDITVLPPKEKEKVEPLPPNKRPENNPFKKVLDSLKIIDEPTSIKTTNDSNIKPASQQIKAINKLSFEQQQYIKTLSKEDQEAYIKLWS